MTIALDASSTCFHLARQLPDIDLTVFTNSLPVCHEMAKRERITLICSGGTASVNIAAMLIRRW